MEVFQAKVKGVRISPRKVRLVTREIHKKLVQDAIEFLRLTNKRSAPVVIKLVNSAIANVRALATVDLDRLVIKEIFVGEGPMMKRFLPRAQGRATPIRKRTSHITVKLQELG